MLLKARSVLVDTSSQVKWHSLEALNACFTAGTCAPSPFEKSSPGYDPII